MSYEIDALQERVDAIRATGDADLAGRAWHALSKVLFEFTREKRGVRRFPIVKRVNATDVEHLLSDLQEYAETLTPRLLTPGRHRNSDAASSLLNKLV
jgi:hypothetical protein